MEVQLMSEKACNCSAPAVLARVAAIAAPHKGREDMLIQVLREAQNVAGNAIARDVAAVIAKEMDLPLVKVYGVVTFYAMFSTEARGRYIIRMCKSAPCQVKGAEEVLKAFEKELKISCGETTADGKFSLETCECLGICDVSPAVMINEEIYGNLTPASVKGIIAKY